MSENEQTNGNAPQFDFQSYPEGTLFYDRRVNPPRRRADVDGSSQPADGTPPNGERRAKKERRRRVDPTTFEKQYTDEEMEFMNAMQRFKVQSGKSFPTHGEVLKVAHELGYRKPGAATKHADRAEVEEQNR
jgi:hypothetical protein